MKEKARHIPGPTRSCRTTLSGSFPYLLPSLLSPIRPKNPYKTRTKSYHFRVREFINQPTSTTYNFNALKCTDFRTAVPFLPVDTQSLASESHDVRAERLLACYPFSLGEKVRMRGKLVKDFGFTRRATNLQILYKTGQNGTISNLFRNQPRCTNGLRQPVPRSSHFRGLRACGRRGNESLTFPEKIGIYRNLDSEF